MAIGPTRFSSYTPSYLSQYYAVVMPGENEIYLHLDVSAIFPGVNPEEAQYKESVSDLLKAVQSYESASFFERWRRRLTTPIQAQERKLALVCEYFDKHSPSGPLSKDSALFQIMKRIEQYPKRLPQRPQQSKRKTQKSHWLGLGTVHSYVQGQAESLWQGIKSFMRTILPFRKSYTKKVQERVKEVKCAMQALYATAITNLSASYFTGKISSPEQWQAILNQAQKELDRKRKKLRAPFKNAKDWRPEIKGMSQADLEEALSTVNANFDEIEVQGQAELEKAKLKIERYEKIRLKLQDHEMEAREYADILTHDERAYEAKLELAELARCKAESASIQTILFSPDSQELQHIDRISAENLREFFSDDQARIDQCFSEGLEKVAKKRMESQELDIEHKNIHHAYQAHLEAMIGVCGLFNAVSVSEKQVEIRSAFEEFTNRLEKEYSSEFNKAYLQQCLPIWKKRMRGAEATVKAWHQILSQQECYQSFLKGLLSLSEFLGLTSPPEAYRHLLEAHPKALRKILASCEKNARLSLLLEQADKLVQEFKKTVLAKEKTQKMQHPLLAAKTRSSLQNPSSLYQHYCLQVMHASYNKILLEREAYPQFCEDAQNKMRSLYEQMAQAIIDSEGDSEQLQKMQGELQETMERWDEFLKMFFKNAILLEESLPKFIPQKAGEHLASGALKNALDEFKRFMQENLFEQVRELLLEANSENILQTAQQALLQSPLNWLSEHFLSIKHDTRAVTYFLCLKTDLNEYTQKFLPSLEPILTQLSNFYSEMLMMSAGGLRWGLEGFDVLPRAKESLNEKGAKELCDSGRIPGGISYFSYKLRLLSAEMKEKAENLSTQLSEENPELSEFIQRSLDWMLKEVAGKHLPRQESLLNFYEKYPDSFLALSSESDLAAWVYEAYRRYNDSVMQQVLEGITSESSPEEIKSLRDRLYGDIENSVQKLREELYRRVSRESPILQLQGLRYARAFWGKYGLFETQAHIDLMIKVWSRLVKSVLPQGSEAFIRENEYCSSALKEVLAKREKFWSGEWGQDKILFERLVRWQWSSFSRVARLGGQSWKEEAEEIQKQTGKMLRYFRMAYHPDRYKGHQQEQIRKEKSDLELQASKLVEKIPAREGVQLTVAFEDEDEILMAEYLQSLFNKLQEIKEFENRISELQRKGRENKAMLVAQEDVIKELQAADVAQTAKLERLQKILADAMSEVGNIRAEVECLKKERQSRILNEKWKQDEVASTFSNDHEGDILESFSSAPGSIGSDFLETVAEQNSPPLFLADAASHPNFFQPRGEDISLGDANSNSAAPEPENLNAKIEVLNNLPSPQHF